MIIHQLKLALFTGWSTALSFLSLSFIRANPKWPKAFAFAKNGKYLCTSTAFMALEWLLYLADSGTHLAINCDSVPEADGLVCVCFLQAFRFPNQARKSRGGLPPETAPLVRPPAPSGVPDDLSPNPPRPPACPEDQIWSVNWGSTRATSLVYKVAKVTLRGGSE